MAAFLLTFSSGNCNESLMKVCWLLILYIAFLSADSASAQETTDEEDLYELADAAAEAEVEKADTVLEKDVAEHGEEWWTREKLIVVVILPAVTLAALVFFVIRWLNKRKRNHD